MARRKLIPGRIQLWNQQVAVDWAEPERSVDDDTMSKVSSPLHLLRPLLPLSFAKSHVSYQRLAD